MGIKRYYAEADNTITNAFKEDLTTRGTGSNIGASDILETFVIHGQTSASISAANAEQARILIQFPIDKLLTDISNGVVPSSSVEYRLKMFNAPHADTTPLSYSLGVAMISKPWTEGRGLDMNEYTDIGSSNWEERTKDVKWTKAGCDYNGNSTHSSSYFLSGGLENLDLNVDFAVSKWRARTNASTNYGFVIKHADNVISGALGSFYTKKFFGRTSDFFHKRPYLEARWNSCRKDNRGNFVVSSSLYPASDNINTLYLYNVVRGELKNIPHIAKNKLRVALYTEKSNTSTPLTIVDSNNNSVTYVTGGLLTENGVEHTGIYTASLASTNTSTTLHDVWFTSSANVGGVRTYYNTGTISPESVKAKGLLYDDQYITAMTNLQDSYRQGRKPRLRVFTRKQKWNPTIYTQAVATIPPEIIDTGFYKVFRIVDGLEILPYGTGSYLETKMSYDVSGSYFHLDTSVLEPGYAYGIKIMYYLQNVYREQPEVFKFRIEEDTP